MEGVLSARGHPGRHPARPKPVIPAKAGISGRLAA
jgi:hypothetical protein